MDRFRLPGRAYSFSELNTLWQQAGLENVETCRIDVPIIFVDFDGFWESNLILASPTSKIVNDLQRADRERLRTYLLQTLPMDAQGRVSVGAFANAVKGQVQIPSAKIFRSLNV